MYEDIFESIRHAAEKRNLRERTIQLYCSDVSYFLRCTNKPVTDLTLEDADAFLTMKRLKGRSPETHNHYRSSIKFLYKRVLKITWDDEEVPAMKRERNLPTVLTPQEINAVIESTDNLKHKAIIATMYSSGLRIGEVCRLRYEDVRRKEMRIFIRHGKNRSSRYAILSMAALDILTQYWFACGRPQGYLFPKQSGRDEPIDSFFLSRHIHAHERRLGWPKRITCHSFRQAFGTHLYENGSDLLTIKALLGHKSIHSTVIYVHLAENGTGSAVSPFDRMGGVTHAQA